MTNVQIKEEEISRRVKSQIHNNHISAYKKESHLQHLSYIYIKKEDFSSYVKHLENGGTMSVTIETFEKSEDKKIKKVKSKVIVSVEKLQLLGIKNKKYGFHRVKVCGEYKKL